MLGPDLKGLEQRIEALTLQTSALNERMDRLIPAIEQLANVFNTPKPPAPDQIKPLTTLIGVTENE